MRRNKLVLLFLLAATIFVFRIEFFLQSERERSVAPYIGPAVVEGEVAGDPERRASSLHAQIEVSRVNNGPAAGRLLSIFPPGAALSYGDRVTVRGKIELPEAFETDTGRVFDYSGYLRAHGVSALMQNATLVKREAGGWSVQVALYGLKHSFERAIERALPEPQSSLLQGITLGERRGISEELNRAFVVSGLVHVVVLSGYNISIVALAIFYLFGFLPRRAGLFAGAFAMILFVLMIGAGATALRALLMGLIGVLAQLLRRPRLALRSLGAAGAAMFLWNPAVFYDPSFVLSMLATFGLITLAPSVEKIFSFLPEWGVLHARSIAASTVAVQIYILPALLYYIGVLSFAALPANMAALPVVAGAMFGGFITGILGMINGTLAFLPALLTNMLLRWIEFVATTAASFPLSSTVIPAFPMWAAVVIYVPLTFIATRLYRSASPSRPN
ncbi:hypothetical protein A2852_01100 [Candidatus Adlerbacteria bacterium RIFCSPHIGHO2_01_FULL_54_23]|uniref:ComEC/Rec2-related protein domain-containing protein n=3 Tax=Candidatus Adleribacteriota TaxID=1752736 RepID=A0A1F4Y0B1_9BACT|nr:MAG: ComEC/Rec2-related protein [Candidatus Adlerbacteria bacterium GW2011_GWA1_54_10]KKW36209.1 MAG: ComEC/Rec2-related protein [Candidatus Adlerbacteria bacterium GW2011_GWA2_54_12]KKW37341.1 MAG: ComEC/Rec2-related protein [Candidatus Adlerbacteria bacterium GW2011_GWB1_54_7]OGC79437.1 MAG: hypothetical protein A2852_01100 [Candidatus Adlerbacteria bacterium RIFCSPHIGHO2_01_FULL_54_23]OGC87415.1 MAG: hypothetical protein A3B33_02050 [Candidatus Adlerbacteria bacterium RIFCSPLOWO2_01_FULL_